MAEWPVIREPELLERLGLSNDRFDALAAGWFAQLGRRVGRAVFELAIGYPWSRPARSYLLTDGAVSVLDDLSPGERADVFARFAERVRVLAIGSNAAPETLQRKFAHFADADDRSGARPRRAPHGLRRRPAAQPAMYGAMPATLFGARAPRSRRRAAGHLRPVHAAHVVELSYRLGRLETRFVADEAELSFDERVRVRVALRRVRTGDGARCAGRDPGPAERAR